METIVIFNMGRDAARQAKPRVAPEAIDYPIVSKYVAYHTVNARLDDWQKREWLRGYDHKERVR